EVVDLTDWWESDVIDFKPEDHAFLKIDEENGYSMMPLIRPGDVVLISFSQKPVDGDIVAARWDENAGAIKVYNESALDPNLIVLTSYNQVVAPIFLRKSQVRLYKVVLIKKKK
ncbi:MAG: S24 family peptidase, partial [Ignavibacteria bacterium]|nr:S24 family peptidase [Ignavibacteria bacterium]